MPYKELSPEVKKSNEMHFQIGWSALTKKNITRHDIVVQNYHGMVSNFQRKNNRIASLSEKKKFYQKAENLSK